MIWTTREGDELEISNMEDLHLLNVINYFYKHREALCRNRANFMLLYALEAPDGAAAAAEAGAMELLEEPEACWIGVMDKDEEMWEIIAESRRRGTYKLLSPSCRASIELQEN